MFNSFPLQYKATVDAVGVFDGTIEFKPPIRIDGTKRHAIQILRADITNNIPNVFSYTDSNGQTTNTGLLRISNDAGKSYTVIQLATGVYSVAQINAAINNVISGWNVDSSDPAFSLKANSVLGKCYITIDSTKLTSKEQMYIDFGYNGSLIGTLLGFTSPTLFATDGEFTSNAFPKLDYFGASIEVHIKGLGPLAITNGQSSDYCCSISIEGNSNSSYFYPGGSGETPIPTPCRIISDITLLEIYLVGRNSTKVLAFDGSFNIDFIIFEEEISRY